ncbi:MAG: site-specific DNA-methyltransferase [Chloroflexi bacterium]|nr:site-specific DNA-methyltransferase [Chloroflexota bacterium]|tara:strand:- start:1587 stop:2438 length:852 start_codon:yes stop_codon:yes gene_type:complete
MNPTADIHFGDNLDILKKIKSESVNLIYIDPPFNTGKIQSRTRIKTTRSEKGDRKGFKGNTYKTEILGEKSYSDIFDNYIDFLRPRVEATKRILAPNGSFFLHLDYREIHYAKVMCDEIFGRDSFINEIIWSYDYGAKSKTKWSAKHDNILWYAKDPNNFTFRYNDIDRIPYMAPGLVGPEKAAKGKIPTDSWWHTIVSPNSKEKTGYPTQKPLGIINRIIKVHSNPEDLILDYFAGSGTTGIAALNSGRNAILVDSNVEALEIMERRFDPKSTRFHNWNTEQ